MGELDDNFLPHRSKMHDGDALSSCNLQNNTQNLLGSYTSSEKYSPSLTTCSLSSCSINISGLE